MIHDELEIRDIWCAAHLLALGVECLRAVSIDGRRTRFVMDNRGDKAHELMLEWRDGKDAMVNGPAFAAAYRRLVAVSQAARLGEPVYDRRYAA